MARDTHALSEPAFQTALEVLVADGVDVRVDSADGYTPTPALSHAILTWNREHPEALADGIVVTPSHNPPADGGFKYNPPSGGPADSGVTRSIEEDANALLRDGFGRVPRVSPERAMAAAVAHDFLGDYVDDLPNVIDMAAIAGSGLRLGVDPLGGAAVAYWAAIAERHGLDLVVTNDRVDPAFAFMTLDWDGQIRMDPSSPHAMARLIALRGDFDLALGNDADADRFGVVTPSAGLLSPNHVLAAARLVSLRRCAPLGRRGGHRQDARVLRAPGPHRGRAGASPLRGARGLQVVRRRPARWLGRLRRRGERRDVLPAARRTALVHGQGRHHRLPAGSGDDGACGARPRRQLRRAHRALRRPALPAPRRARHARAEGCPGASLRGGRALPPSWPGDPVDGPTHRGARQRGSPSAA